MPELKICPYPGLRPFNENEAIFFKGRDEHIDQVIEQLEQNKFIMLTGASGDGKSSLVYAGVIPNARAGFFKAKFNNWILADFRPERDPLKNLSKTLSQKLNINDDEKTEKELSYGFSSLIDLYKSSPYFTDTKSEVYKNADQAERKKLKRNAANLIILADQFEEFFTNIENFSNDVPSLRAQTVVNLLLETSRIALAEDIPVYIICTMRSDYIGQCAAFHGLPEYIGFSQFFVPRLKRKEIQQVIEEPATLSGCKISNRLTQILINELGEGFDQLPVLQHALNQIWHEAVDGDEVMDMIHLAKLGGMPNRLLSEEDKIKFEKWFDKLSTDEQNFLKNPSLENLLNAHANELYERAARLHYNESHPQEISFSDAELIIKTAFQCLTRIDHSRAVRSRMTLQEITDIINKPTITINIVAGVLEIFRMEGNTFLKPFITDEAETQKLNSDDVLDITHESLIRNWKLLHEWAHEEYKNYSTFLDFNKQLQRWVENKKSSGYLLPIGPLSFFEKWFDTAEPNRYWLKKYDDSDEPDETKLKNAAVTIRDAEQFIKRSARKLFVSRTILKYGARKITTVAGIIALIFVCTFYYFDYRRKQNEYVLKEIEKKCVDLITRNDIPTDTKGNFLIAYNRLEPGAYKNLLTIFPDTTRFDIEINMFRMLAWFKDDDKIRMNPMVDTVITDLNNLGMKFLINEEKDETLFRRASVFMRLLIVMKSNNYRVQFADSLFGLYCNKIYDNYLAYTLQKVPDSITSNVLILNNIIELILNNNCTVEKIDSMISWISPLENSQTAVKRFKKLFPANEKIILNRWQKELAFSHNAGYQIISYLYACKGDYAKLNSSLDSILKYNKSYKQFENEDFNNLLSYLILYNHFPTNESEVLIEKYREYSGWNISEIFYENLLSLNSNAKQWNITSSKEFAFFNQNQLLAGNSREKVWDYYIEKMRSQVDGFLTFDKLIRKSNYVIDSPLFGRYNNEMNFLLAMKYKQRGIQQFTQENDTLLSEKYFKIAIEYYHKTDSAFRNSAVKSHMSNTWEIKYSDLFLYPVFVDYEDRRNQRDLSNEMEEFDNEDKLLCFQNFLLQQKDKIYISESDFNAYENFLFKYYFSYKVGLWGNTIRQVFNWDYFNIAHQMIRNNDIAKKSIDSNFISMTKCLNAFEQNDTISAFNFIKEINLQNVLYYQYQNQEEIKSYVLKYLLKNIAVQFALINKTSQSFKFINAFQPFERRNIMTDIIITMQNKGAAENTFIYLDSIYNYIEQKPSFPQMLLNANGRVGSKKLFDESTQLIKLIPDNSKSNAIQYLVKGIAESGYYYKATTFIPPYASPKNEMEFYLAIMNADLKRKMIRLSSDNSKFYNDYFRNDEIIFNEGAFLNMGNSYELTPGITFNSTSSSNE